MTITKKRRNVVIRKSINIYLVSAFAVPVICFIFGWRSIEKIGTGFMYGSIGLVLFGALTLAGNTVPAQISKLSIPKYTPTSLKRHQGVESDSPLSANRGGQFFLMALICGVFLFLTGLCLKML